MTASKPSVSVTSREPPDGPEPPPAGAAEVPPPATPADPMLQAIEHRTVELGSEIFGLMKATAGGTLRRRAAERVESGLLRLLMGDERLRVSLLRFVDVFPALGGPAEIAEHLREYLREPVPARRRGSTRAALARRALGSSWAPDWATARAGRWAITMLGRRFIAGRTPEEVAPRIRTLERQGFRFTLDLLGESVTSEAQADRFAARYREMVDGLARLLGPMPPQAPDGADDPRVNISIKLSSLASHFDPLDEEGTAAGVLARLKPLARAARAGGVFLNIDMEKREYRDLTLRLARRLLEAPEWAGYPHVGIVMQAYLVDAEPTLTAWLDWVRARRRSMTIRLVKGAYWDSEQIGAAQNGWPCPVLTEKSRTDAQFERMTRRLLQEHGLVRTAVGSHNVRSIAHALALAESLHVPPDRLEIQLLYGMADPLARALRAFGHRPRTYVPCGELIPGMAYLVRRILENTAQESFLRQRALGETDEADLLRDPKLECAS